MTLYMVHFFILILNFQQSENDQVHISYSCLNTWSTRCICKHT